MTHEKWHIPTRGTYSNMSEKHHTWHIPGKAHMAYSNESEKHMAYSNKSEKHTWHIQHVGKSIFYSHLPTQETPFWSDDNAVMRYDITV